MLRLRDMAENKAQHYAEHMSKALYKVQGGNYNKARVNAQTM